jgi:hypothetical protein
MMLPLVFIWLLHVALLLSIFSAVSASGIDGEVDSSMEKRRLIVILSSILLIAAPDTFGCKNGKPKRKQSQHCKWKRRFVFNIFQEMGLTFVRRSYRMDAESFYKLHQTIKKYMTKKKSPRNKKKKDNGKNRVITTIV